MSKDIYFQIDRIETEQIGCMVYTWDSFTYTLQTYTKFFLYVYNDQQENPHK